MYLDSLHFSLLGLPKTRNDGESLWYRLRGYLLKVAGMKYGISIANFLQMKGFRQIVGLFLIFNAAAYGVSEALSFSYPFTEFDHNGMPFFYCFI